MSNGDDAPNVIDHGDLPVKVTVMETEVKQIKRDVGELRDDIAGVRGSQGRLESKLGEVILELKNVGRADIKTVIQMLAGAGVIVGAIWGLAIGPINSKLESVESVVYETKREASANETDINKLEQRTGLKQEEVEMQFKMLGVLMNEKTQHEERLRAIMWRQIFGNDLPARDYWPDLGRMPPLTEPN